jgi:hypothetical protein
MLIIKKSNMQSSLVIIWLMTSLFVLHYGFIKLPFEYVTHIQIIWFLASCLFVIPLYGRHIISGLRRIKYLHYVLVMMMFPFFYAVIGRDNLEQTFWEGVVAGRIFFWLFVLIVMATFIHCKLVSRHQIIISLKNLSWLCLLIYIVIILFADLTKSRTYDNTELRGERLRFDATFIIYGFMYYYLLALTSKKYLKNYLLCVPFLAFLMIYLQSRAVLSALILAAVIVPLFSFSLAAKVKFLCVTIVATVCLFVIVQIKPDYKLALLFQYLFEFITEGNTVDNSANYRSYEAVIAIESIADRPWFGIGLINYQANMIQEIFGRVNVADVGILGIIMEYGYVGTIALMAQFLPVWAMLLFQRSKKTLTTEPRTFQLLLLMNVYMFFMCIFTGLLAYAPLSVMLFTCLLLTRSDTDTAHAHRG